MHGLPIVIPTIFDILRMSQRTTLIHWKMFQLRNKLNVLDVTSIYMIKL